MFKNYAVSGSWDQCLNMLSCESRSLCVSWFSLSIYFPRCRGHRSWRIISVNWSSEYVVNVIWCYYDFVVGVDGHGRTMTWLDMIWQIFCCAKSMRIIQNFSSVMEKSPTSPFNFPWTFTCTRRTSHRQLALFLALWHLRLLACVISIGTTKVSLGSWLSDVSELLSDMHHPFLSRFGCWTCWKA